MKLESLKTIATLMASCLAILLVCLGPALSADDTPPANPAPPPISPEKQGEMREIRLTEIQDGEKKWVLTAADADYLKDRGQIFIKKVWVEIFGKDDTTVIITGDEGIIDIKTRALTLEGNVQAQTRDYNFSTASVQYDPQLRLLSAPGAVKVQGPRLIVEGKGMTVDLREKKLSLAEHTLTKLRVAGNLWN